MREFNEAEYKNWCANVTADDYFESTAAIFKQATAPDREPDYESASGSKYWLTDSGVYRVSNHWGYSIASCKWWLEGVAMDEFGTVEFSGSDYRELCGYVELADMVRCTRGDEYWGWFED